MITRKLVGRCGGIHASSGVVRDNYAAAVRGVMNENIDDRGLLDVSKLGLGELMAETDDSAFGRALNRILSSPADGACNGFQASI
jgi:hypothetical protein